GHDVAPRRPRPPHPRPRSARTPLPRSLDAVRPLGDAGPMEVGDIKGRVDFGIITIREDELAAVLDRFPKLDIVKARRRYRIRQLQLPNGEVYTIAVVRCAEQGNT